MFEVIEENIEIFLFRLKIWMMLRKAIEDLVEEVVVSLLFS